MGFTIQDMMIISGERYSMKYVAGNRGWANSISWVHLVEDTKIIQHFWGKELAVTTGLGFSDDGKLKPLIDNLIEHHSAGLIINTGKYIEKIPKSIIDYCDENDFPLLTVPWEVFLADMIKDFTIRIFMQGTADQQISKAIIQAIENPGNQDAYRKDLLEYFDVDGMFQVVLITTDNLDEMDTVERQKLSYQLQMYLENITHNGNFAYYDGNFLLVVNDVTKKQLKEIVDGLIHRTKIRMTDRNIYVGIGSIVKDVSKMNLGYIRAKAAVSMAAKRKESVIYFDDMGLYRLLYMVNDESLINEMGNSPLRKLIEYDEKHKADYVGTLELYLKHNGSIQAVAEEMFTHRNTIIYRMTKIKEMLGTNLDETEERLPFQIAYYIRNM